jgi:urease accessory protein
MVEPDLRCDVSGLLAALQLADSFFPSGMFAQSQGLEAMYRRGLVTNAAELEELLDAQVRWSVLPSDGVALLNAYRAAASGHLGEVIEIDRRLEALRIPAELRRASCHTGRRLLVEISTFVQAAPLAEYQQAVDGGGAPGNAAVVWGVVAPVVGISAPVALGAFCHSYCVGVLGAALRLLPISHRDAQRLRYRLNNAIAGLVQEIEGRHWTEMESFLPQLDIAAQGHEIDTIRMFAS